MSDEVKKCDRCGRRYSVSAGCPDTCQLDWVFTEDQVQSLNAYQAAGVMHPFTCTGGGTHPHHANVDLVARREGWYCPVSKTIVQKWAHDFMLDWSWEKHDWLGRTWDRDQGKWK